MKALLKTVLTRVGLDVHRLKPGVMPVYFDLNRCVVPTPDGRAPKAAGDDGLGRYREIVMDPLNLAIRRVPQAGLIEGHAVILHNGNRAGILGENSYYGAWSAILAINRGVHEPLQEYVFQEMLERPGDAPVMIELGSYWAHYSMWLKKARPNAKTFMVEPVPEYLAVGRRNFALNDMNGEFTQAFVGRGQWQLDGFLRGRSIPHVDVLLADIEGYEVEMLEGAQRSLAGHAVDYLFISTHSQHLHERVMSILERSDHRIEVSSDFDHHTTSCDGVVIASSPNASPIFTSFQPLGREELVTKAPADLVSYLASLDIR